MGETVERFARLENKALALSALRGAASSAGHGLVRRAIAYAVAELRRIENLTFEGLEDDLIVLMSEVGIEADDIKNKNVTNFVGRTTERPNEHVLAACGLYLWRFLEGSDAPKLTKCLLPGQMRLLEWARDTLQSGKGADLAPLLDITAPERVVDQSLVFGKTVQEVRDYLDSRVGGALSDAQLRQRLMGDDPEVHQIGFLCFRSAFNNPRRIVQSYLTILAPERSRLPFWTFAHIYVREGQPDMVRFAGGLVVTTTKALYLVGAEGWMAQEHLGEPAAISKHLKPNTLTMFAIPIETIGDISPIRHGIAMCSNADDRPVIARMALHRTSSPSHNGLVGLVEVEAFRARMKSLVDKQLIDLGLAPMADEAPNLHAQRVEARLTAQTNNILTAINNRPEWQFLSASPKNGQGAARTHNNLMTDLNKIFMHEGEPLFLAPDGTPYAFDVHQWFNAISWD